MGNFSEMELLKMTQEIAVSAAGAASGDKAQAFQCPEEMTAFIQAVYDKLKEINGSIGS